MEESRRYMEQALQVAERIGNPDQTAFILGNLGTMLVTLGDWEGAGEYLERTIALLGNERMARAAAPLSYLGQLAFYQGKWEEARQWLGDALAVAQRTGDRQALEQTQALLAELDVLVGRPEEATHRVEELASAEDVHLVVPPVLAWALLEAGEVERADEVVSNAVRRARAGQERFYLLEALRVQGMVWMHQDRCEEAESAFQEGLELARSLPYPYAEGRVLYEMGVLERQRGEPERAQERLDEALAIFRKLGAGKDIERTEHVLAGPHSRLERI
jgi:tetratricopeptide (TPR) repeat protein